MTGGQADAGLPHLALGYLVIQSSARVEHSVAEGEQGGIVADDVGRNLGSPLYARRPEQFNPVAGTHDSFETGLLSGGGAFDRNRGRKFDVGVRLVERERQ